MDDLIKAGSGVITDDAEGPDISMNDVIADLNKLLKPEVNDTNKLYTSVRAGSFSTTSTAPSTDDVTGNNDRPISLSMKINNDDGNDHESEISRSTSSGK